MAGIKGFKNLEIISKIGEERNILIRVLNRFYRCESVEYSSESDYWIIKKSWPINLGRHTQNK
jgi:hypothetical protein